MEDFLRQPSGPIILPLVGGDYLLVFRNGDKSKPLYIKYSDFAALIAKLISPSSKGILLKTNGANNTIQDVLNLVEDGGITITSDLLGNVKFKVTGGTPGIDGIDGANSRRWFPLNIQKDPTTSGAITLRNSVAPAFATTEIPSAVGRIVLNKFDDTGADMSAWIVALQTYVTANHGKAYIQITDSTNNSLFGIYQVGNIVTSPTFYSIYATYIAGNGPFVLGNHMVVSWVLFGADGTSGIGGITSIDGDTTAAQTLSNGFSGTAPNWSSLSAGDRLLNIPMANAPGVTAGLISKTAYDGFRLAQFPYVQKQFNAANAPRGLVKVPNRPRLFVNNNGSSSLYVYDTDTGILLYAHVVAAISVMYVSLLDEVWAYNNTNFERYNATTGAYISSTPSGFASLNYGNLDLSSINNHIYFYVPGGAAGRIWKYNVLTGVTGNYGIGGSGVAGYDLIYVTTGLMAGCIIGSAQNGIFAFDTATDTIRMAINNLGGTFQGGYGLTYIEGTNTFIAVSYSNNNVVLCTITSSTTIALTVLFSSINTPSVVKSDVASGRAWVFSRSPIINTNAIITTINLTTQAVEKTSQAIFLGTQFMFADIDKVEKSIYIMGQTNLTQADKIIYA
jgi:hypothetical protein